MKAIIALPGTEVNLKIVECEFPRLLENEVMVKILAAGVNRADLLQARGLYPPPPGASDILGLECAGEIADIGSQVRNWSVGDRVCALLAGGGYSEFVNVPQDMLLRVPSQLSYEEAAAIPEAFYTAYLNLINIGQLKAGQDILIHAGASGVGTAAIQIAKYYGGRVFVSVGSDGKGNRCLELGADHFVNYHSQDFKTKILEWTNTRGVDLILDSVGAAYFNDNVQLLKKYGRLISIGLMGGSATEINLDEILTKNISINGSTLRNKSLQEKTALTTEIQANVLPLFSTRALIPIVDRIFPFSQVSQAHAHMRENKNVGKIILSW